MSASQAEKDSWNEFQWELELRKDDARIAAYIDELPKYIDLPDEDKIILEKMHKRGPELTAPADSWWSTPGPVPYDGEQDDADDPENDPPPGPEPDWLHCDGGVLYRNCSILANNFALFAAKLPPGTSMEKLMRILCLYGKLIARANDLIDMSMTLDPEEYEDPDPAPVPLRIALCKRILADVDALRYELKTLLPPESDAFDYIDSHVEACGHMHDYVIEVLMNLRHPDIHMPM